MSKNAEDLFPEAVVKNPCADIPDRGLIGYHFRPIPRGVYGELSKVLEEAAECEDAQAQGCGIMLMLELSDLVGAVRGYLAKRSLSFEDLGQRNVNGQVPWVMVTREFDALRKATGLLETLVVFTNMFDAVDGFIIRWNLHFMDLTRMADATQRAFRSGQRKRKDAGETLYYPAPS